MGQQRFICLLTALLFVALPTTAENYDSLVAQALEFRNNGDMPAAEQLLRQAYSGAADKRETAYLLALVLAYQEKFAEADDLLEQSLSDYPGNFDLQLTKARVESYQGSFALASQTVGELLARNPDNEDALILAGRVHLYQRQYLAGKEKFLKALSSNPSNLDALIGLYDSEVYLGNVQHAGNYLSRAAIIDSENADVVSRKNGHKVMAGPRHIVSLSLDSSRLNRRNMSNWHEQFVEYRHGLASEDQFYLRYEHANRFEFNDSYWEAGAVLRDSVPLPMSISIGKGTESIFLPEQRFRLGTEFNLNDGDDQFGATIGYLSYLHSRYASGKVQQTSFDLEHYLVNTNAWITPGLSFTRDESANTSFGFQFGWNHQIAPRFRYGLRYSDVPETENNVTTDTKTRHGYLRYRLTDQLVGRIDYANIQRKGSYTRDSLSLSLDYRF